MAFPAGLGIDARPEPRRAVRELPQVDGLRSMAVVDPLRPPSRRQAAPAEVATRQDVARRAESPQKLYLDPPVKSGSK